MLVAFCVPWQTCFRFSCLLTVMLCKSPSLPIKTEEETLSLNYRKIWGALILFFRFYTLLRAGERVEGVFSIRSALYITSCLKYYNSTQKIIYFPQFR